MVVAIAMAIRQIIPVLLMTSWTVLVAGLDENLRINCLPGSPNPQEAECVAKGCLFSSTSSLAPNCYLPPTYGYRVEDSSPTPNGNLFHLQRNLRNTSMFGNDFDHVTIEFEAQTASRLSVKIAPSGQAGEERYQVPIEIEGAEDPVEDTLFELRFNEEPVFSFQVVRKSSGVVVFDSGLGGLTVSDQFLQIGGLLPSKNVYGFAEHEQPSLKHDLNWKTWGMFSRDVAPQPDSNLYGVHPHYTVLEDTGDAHGVLFLNSNAQDVTLSPAPSLVYRTIGGILDIYFFLGPTPEDVVAQYTEAIGRYYVPPYWSLGFHLCRWGYNSLENMRAAWQRTIDADIPFDAQWGDIDIMDRALDFTVNPTDFSLLDSFVEEIHSLGMKFVTILDPCITTGEPPGTYPPFDLGDFLDIWIKNSSGQPLVAKVWPAEHCVFPDYSNPLTEDWWVNQILDFHTKLGWDGLWIDMNEPANFVNGSVHGCPHNSLNNPPYKPKTVGDKLFDKTICLDAVQHWGSHYDTHSMFGWSETRPTLKGVREATGKRGLVLSRSTFIGSGRWTAHWLGDNWSEWDNLHFSIIGMLQFNQLGVPLVGADICGFILNTTEEMCARWHQLGAFYPFSRNHNNLDSVDQDPGVFSSGLVASFARESLTLKYLLLPYLYSLFYSHSLEGHTVVRPLWHEFPKDKVTWAIDDQFMWGKGLVVSPIIHQGRDERQVYLPEEATWYDLAGNKVSGGNITVENPLDTPSPPPIHFRGGSVLPMQTPNKTTAQSRKNGFALLVALDGNKMARGDLYLDDGEAIDDNMEMYSHVEFRVSDGSMDGIPVTKGYTVPGPKIARVMVLGVGAPIMNVMVNNQVHTDFEYSADTNNLEIFNLNLDPIEAFNIHWME